MGIKSLAQEHTTAPTVEFEPVGNESGTLQPWQQSHDVPKQ